jgi:hypothetical protein
MTQDEVATMERMAETGHTARQIADVLGCGIGRVFDAANERGIPLTLEKKRITMPLKARIERMVGFGMTSAMIGTVVGRSRMSVESIRCTYDIRRPKYPRSVHTRVTQKCWDRLVQAARTHGATSPNRVAGVCLEVMTAERLDLLPYVLPPPIPVKGAPLSSLQPQLEARI